MYTQDNVPPPEYRVRTVVRYIVTRYCHPYTHVAPTVSESHSFAGGSAVVCEVPGEQDAYDVAHALADSEGATVEPAT